MKRRFAVAISAALLHFGLSAQCLPEIVILDNYWHNMNIDRVKTEFENLGYQNLSLSDTIMSYSRMWQGTRVPFSMAGSNDTLHVSYFQNTKTLSLYYITYDSTKSATMDSFLLDRYRLKESKRAKDNHSIFTSKWYSPRRTTYKVRIRQDFNGHFISCTLSLSK